MFDLVVDAEYPGLEDGVPQDHAPLLAAVLIEPVLVRVLRDALHETRLAFLNAVADGRAGVRRDARDCVADGLENHGEVEPGGGGGRETDAGLRKVLWGREYSI